MSGEDSNGGWSLEPNKQKRMGYLSFALFMDVQESHDTIVIKHDYFTIKIGKIYEKNVASPFKLLS